MDQLKLYYSTNLRSPHASFKEALIRGLAPDGGLYMPLVIPLISFDTLESFRDKNYPEIASEILYPFTRGEIDKKDLLTLCEMVYTFKIPIEKVYDNNHVMRLDQGPTASFKDFAALLMGRLMQFFLQADKQKLTILTATSGDTGSAVANAYYGLDNIKVIILYPAAEVSELQRRQMTTLHRNISVISVDGKFDDCQNLVKKAFMDESLSRFRLSSANSINIGRLLPQAVYYFWAWSRLSGMKDEHIVFSVPSGNFGNVTGGLIAREMGLPISRFVISTNENDEVPEYLRTGLYNIISPSKNCISSAMNVGHPSNLARLISLFGGIMDEKGNIIKPPDMVKMRKDLYSVSVSDHETKETITKCFNEFNIVLEPHGAVAWHGLQKFLKHNPGYGKKEDIYVSLETAHPGKFRKELERLLNTIPSLPDSFAKIESAIEEYISLENNYESFKNFIIRN